MDRRLLGRIRICRGRVDPSGSRPNRFHERALLERTSLDITILILTVLIIRGIFVFGRRANPGKRNDPDPAQETLKPTEEVVFFLSVILLAVSIVIWYVGG